MRPSGRTALHIYYITYFNAFQAEGEIIMKKMNSINETFKLCKEHNIGISRRLLLTLVNSGEIPSVKAGRSILVNWEGLMKYLDNHTITQDEPVSRIRKITA